MWSSREPEGHAYFEWYHSHEAKNSGRDRKRFLGGPLWEAWFCSGPRRPR